MESDLNTTLKSVNQLLSLLFPQMFLGATIIVTITMVVWVARSVWGVVKWALRWLVYLLKDERKKKKEDYTAHYDDLLGIEPTWWQRFRDWLLPLLESLTKENESPSSKRIRWRDLPPEDRRIYEEGGYDREWFERGMEPENVDYDSLLPHERERAKQEMYRGLRAWDVRLMRSEEADWLAYKQIRARHRWMRHDESEWQAFMQTSAESEASDA